MEEEWKLERCSPEQVGISSDKVRKCLEALEHEKTQMHGFMAARYNKVFAECWWTPYGPDVIHCNHSLGKSYVATAIGILYTQGKLSMEECIAELFHEEMQEYGIVPNDNMKKLTVRHVLTMTNGMVKPPIMDRDWLKNYLAEPVEIQPGSEFLYNSSGSCLLGAIVKKKTGIGLKDFLEKFLFSKIGIDGDRFQIFKFQDGYDAEPGTVSVTEDNLRLALLYMNYGKWNEEQIVARDWMEQAMSCQIPTGAGAGSKDYQHGYGFQLWNSSVPGLYRFDGGQGQFGLIWPDKKVVVALHEGAICPDGPQITLDIITKYLLDELGEEALEEDVGSWENLKAFEKSRCVPESEPNRFFLNGHRMEKKRREAEQQDTICELPRDFVGKYQVISGDGDPWISVSPGGYNFFSCFYHMDKKQRFTDFILEQDEEKCTFAVNGYAIFQAWFDGKHHPEYTDNVIPEIGWNCSYARYLGENKLEIVTRWLNGWFDDRIVMEKEGDGIDITFYKDRLLEGNGRYMVTHCKAKRIMPDNGDGLY